MLNSKKNYIVVDGLTHEHVVGTDPVKKTFQVKVKAFDNNEMSTSKLILKIGLESLYQSQNTVFKSYDFSELKEYMTNKNNNDWPFINSSIECHPFKSVARFYDKYQLKYLECNLTFCAIDTDTLLFKFQYSCAKYIVNLINRQIKWTDKYFENDKECSLYPKHMSPKKDGGTGNH